VEGIGFANRVTFTFSRESKSKSEEHIRASLKKFLEKIFEKIKKDLRKSFEKFSKHVMLLSTF